jgi:hypothetical protein
MPAAPQWQWRGLISHNRINAQHIHPFLLDFCCTTPPTHPSKHNTGTQALAAACAQLAVVASQPAGKLMLVLR